MDAQPIESVRPWLGGRRYWLTATAAILVLVLAALAHLLWVGSRTAAPQEAFVLGEWTLTPGQPASYRVFVRDASTGEPRPAADVELQLRAADGTSVWHARQKTGDDGVAVARTSLADEMAEGTYTLTVRAVSADGTNEITQPVRVERSFRVLVSTDKPLYQPGQVIHIRTLSLATADLRPAAGRDLTLEVHDAKGNKVMKRRLVTSEHGIAAADFALADQVLTGEYTVAATLGDTTSERAVTVERYRLPKFRLDLTTGKSFYQPGEVLHGTLTARYTFGEAVRGGAVAIAASELVETFRPFATVEGVTDENGRFAFEIPLKEHFVGQPLKRGDGLLSLEATVTDAAAHTQRRTLERTVTDEAIRVDVVPESGTLVPDVANVVYIVTSYPDGTPAETTIQVRGLPEGETKIPTSAAGIATFEMTPETETLELSVVAEDRHGARVEVTRVLEPDSAATVLLRTDRAVAKGGETVTLQVFAPRADGRVFVDVVKDRRTVLTTALEVAAGRGELLLDLPEDLFGTLEIHAYRVTNDGLLTSDAKILQVLRADDLEIRVELDKETYRPGEKAVLDFLVTRGSDGEGVPAALSLSGVDEAVFALQEMRPGLERVYFALLEELLKPRYEIHGHLPATPSDALEPATDETTAVLFAAAAGSAGPGTATDGTYRERQSRLWQAKQAEKRRFAATLALVPIALWLLLLLPLPVYATLRLLRGRPIEGASPEALRGLRRPLRGVVTGWLLGLYVPLLAMLLGAWLSPSPMDDEVALLLGGLTALGALVLLAHSVIRLRRHALAPSVPLLRRLVSYLPVAYPAAILLLFGLFTDLWDEIDETVVASGLLAMAFLTMVTPWAVSVAGWSVLERLTLRRKCWLSLSRLALGFVPVFFLTFGLTHMGARSAPPQFVAVAVADGAVLEEKAMARRADVDERSAEPSAAAGLKAATRVRRHFPETLLFEPEVLTDANGRLRYEVPLADSITTWRLAMSAVSRDGELGAGEKGLRVFQDFFVDLDLPVALTQNDAVSVPVAVYNYLDTRQDVRLLLEAGEGIELAGPASKTLTVEANSVRGTSFRLVARRPGEATLLLRANGSEMADALERTVRVEPDGEAFVETRNGTLEEWAEEEFFVPEDAIDGADDLVLKIYNGAFSQVMEGLDGIFQMPFGCFEQTSSTTYPNVLVLDYLRGSDQIKPEVEIKALEYIRLGYQRLLTFEVQGGGFEWFGQEPAHTVLTAYGLLEFSDMSRVFEVDPAVIARTRNWLYSQQEGDGSWKPTTGGIAEGAINAFAGQVLRTTAYVAWAMASSGESDPRLSRALDFLAEEIVAEDDPYTLALAVNALAASPDARDRTVARKVLERLEAMRQEDDAGVYWSSSAEGVTYSSGDTLAVETTALTAYALIESGFNVDTGHKALAWLIAHKDPNGTWRSTQATVHAMRALLKGASGSALTDDVTVSVAVNGEPVKEIVITPDDADVHRLISLRESAGPGRTAVTLRMDGVGSLAYQVVATHYRPWAERPAKPLEPLSIEQEYDTVKLAADDILTARVTVSYNRPGTANMTIVDLGIPPGFELRRDAFDALVTAGRIERYSVTPRQVILYFREIRSGEPVAFAYELRAKYPLTVKAPSSSVYAYYEPSLRDETEPVTLSVE